MRSTMSVRASRSLINTRGIRPAICPIYFVMTYIHKIIQDASRRQGSDKFVGNEFEQPQAAFGEGHGCPAFILRSVHQYVTGVSDCSQHRGSLNDDVYKRKQAALSFRKHGLTTTTQSEL